MTEEKKFTPKFVNSAEDLIFYTNTDELQYPIYILPDRSIQYKKKPDQFIAEFFVANVNNVDEQLSHPLLPIANQAISNVGKYRYTTNIMIKYEVYNNTGFIGEATGYAIKIEVEIMSTGTHEKQAWAVAFDTSERIKKKHPELTKYVYPKVGWKRRQGYTAIVYIKLPVVTDEFKKIFDTVMAQATITQTTSPLAELEEQVRQLEQLIEQKRAELQQLEQQYQNLKMKLELERLKHAVT